MPHQRRHLGHVIADELQPRRHFLESVANILSIPDSQHLILRIGRKNGQYPAILPRHVLMNKGYTHVILWGFSEGGRS